MAEFIRGRSITTRTPTITVDNRLEVGNHRFQLVVRTDDGRSSAPVVATVTVVRVFRPGPDNPVLTDPIRPVDPVRPGPIEPVRPGPINPVRPIGRPRRSDD